MPLAFPQLLWEGTFLQSLWEWYTLTNLAFQKAYPLPKKHIHFLRGYALSVVDWLTLEIRENKGLIFLRGCALSEVEWLTLEIQENKSLNFSQGCTFFLVDWLTLKNREYKGLNFFKGVCTFSG